MPQYSFSDVGLEKYRKQTRKEQFLEETETIILWRPARSYRTVLPLPEGAGQGKQWYFRMKSHFGEDSRHRALSAVIGRHNLPAYEDTQHGSIQCRLHYPRCNFGHFTGGKVAVVTGASAGLGIETARALAQPAPGRAGGAKPGETAAGVAVAAH